MNRGAREKTAVFIMPGVGNFIQDFDKNDPQSNINLDTLKKSRCKISKENCFSFKSSSSQKSNKFYKS